MTTTTTTTTTTTRIYSSIAEVQALLTEKEAYFAQRPVNRSRVAYVTMLHSSDLQIEQRYVRAVMLWIRTLRESGSQEEIVVLLTEDLFNDREVKPLVEQQEELRFKIKYIARHHQILGVRAGYQWQLNKLAIWTLEEYDQVAYYDADHIVMRNPDGLFAECGRAMLCATQDTGIPEHYFNGGFLVIRPDREIYRALVQVASYANNRQFAEQDMLNDLFKNKWRGLAVEYNWMHINRRDVLNAAVFKRLIAIHEKFWVLSSDPALRGNRHFPWNRG
jgi:alpha-N-acetylglucosamine transferase